MRNEKGQFIKGHRQSFVQRKKMSVAKKKRPTRYWKGRRRPDIATKFRGNKSHFWKGGLTPINKILRESSEYKLWREAVFERDNYTCIWCGIKNGEGKSIELNADHIKPFSLFPELRFAIDNGRTLCRECHLTTETFGGNSHKKNVSSRRVN